MVIRTNRIGLHFSLIKEDDKTRVVFQKKSIVVDVPFDDFVERWYRYEFQGVPVQRAFDNVPADEREFLITGITPDEWDKIFMNTMEAVNDRKR